MFALTSLLCLCCIYYTLILRKIQQQNQKLVHHKSLWVGKKQTKKVEPQSHSDLAICYAMKEELLRLFELKDHTEAGQGWKNGLLDTIFFGFHLYRNRRIMYNLYVNHFWG